VTSELRSVCWHIWSVKWRKHFVVNLRVKTARLLDSVIRILRQFSNILLQTKWVQCKSVASCKDVILLIAKLPLQCINIVKYIIFQFFVIQSFVIASCCLYSFSYHLASSKCFPQITVTTSDYPVGITHSPAAMPVTVTSV